MQLALGEGANRVSKGKDSRAPRQWRQERWLPSQLPDWPDTFLLAQIGQRLLGDSHAWLCSQVLPHPATGSFSLCCDCCRHGASPSDSGVL